MFMKPKHLLGDMDWIYRVPVNSKGGWREVVELNRSMVGAWKGGEGCLLEYG